MRLVEEKAPPLRVLQAYGMDKFAGGWVANGTRLNRTFAA
ncbi:hypothetical protein PF003_g37203 [Phytophthora fragariae]|nr:hypothetical protein PF003_g37203 [Phytophthora fragariae]